GVAEFWPEGRPAAFTANPIKKERRGRIYLDYLRNSRGATAVGAYSPGERAGTPVCTPLTRGGGRCEADCVHNRHRAGAFGEAEGRSLDGDGRRAPGDSGQGAQAYRDLM